MKWGAQVIIGAICLTAMSNLAAVTAAVQTAKDEEVQFIGRYSNIRYTAEHAYGNDLQLWRDGTSIVGLWSRTNGPPSDFPAVLATDLLWDQATGSLRFAATWCDETESLNGVLQNGQFTGTITSSRRSQRAESRRIALRKEDDDWGPMPRAEWKALMDRILGTRGPKC